MPEKKKNDSKSNRLKAAARSVAKESVSREKLKKSGIARSGASALAASRARTGGRLSGTGPRSPQRPRTILTSAAHRWIGAPAEDPRIVLEDDPAGLAAHKFDLEMEESAIEESQPDFELPEFEDLGELPAVYGTRRLFLIARDPQWLFAYWDLTHAQMSEGERAAHDGKLFLQVYLSDGTRVQQIQISPWSHDWYLHASPRTRYYAEIGYYRHDGGFEVLARSGQTETPPDSISWRTDVRFVTIPFHYTFRQLMELIQQYRREGEELAETLARLQEEGFPFPFDVGRPANMSEEEAAQLLSAIGAVSLRRIQQGSGEIVELLRRDLLRQLSSGQWVSSISSPFGASFGLGGRSFYMDVNAELIIYGGTDPQARVRIDGKPITLSPDGRFYYHFNFKDGRFHIPVEAESPDGIETRSALLSFMRLTDLGPGVEATPQGDRPVPMGEVK